MDRRPLEVVAPLGLEASANLRPPSDPSAHAFGCSDSAWEGPVAQLRDEVASMVTEFAGKADTSRDEARARDEVLICV